MYYFNKYNISFFSDNLVDECGEGRFTECLELEFGNEKAWDNNLSISHLTRLVADDKTSPNHVQYEAETINNKGPVLPQYYNDLRCLIVDEVKSTDGLVDSLMFSAHDVVNIRDKEESLLEMFSKLQPEYPDMVQQLSCFYRFHSASIDMERMNRLQSCPSKFLQQSLHVELDNQLRMIIDRVQSSLQLLASRSESTKSSTTVRSRPVLCRRSLKVLEQWYQSHLEHPYPTAQQVEQLAEVSNLTVEQVKKWFGNKRSRARNTRSLTEIAKVKRRQRLLTRV